MGDAGAVSTPASRLGAESSWLRGALSSTAGMVVGRTAILGGLLVTWELASGRWLPAFWVSSPSKVVRVLIGWIKDGSLWGHVFATLSATGLGYSLGALTGIVAGLLLGFLPRVAQVSAPFVTALYALPKVALAPLFVIFFGIDLESKVALVAVTVFFLLLYNTLDGVRDIDRDFVHAVFLMGGTRVEVTRKVLIPATLPWIFTGLRIAVRYAFTAAILGELIASNKGIGFLVEYSAGQFDAAGVYAAVLVLVICSVVLQELLVRVEVSTLGWRL